MSWNWRERLHQYMVLTRLHRPIGIYLLLWPALWALWLAADGHPDSTHVIIFIIGTVLMRSAGCVINDYADREFDPHVSRTRERPIATGQVSPREALILFAVLCLLALLVAMPLNTLTLLLAIPAVVLAAIYPFTKRVTHFPQAWLGAAFGWAVPMAFTAETGSVPTIGWALYGITLIWALAYDTYYAMCDREDDLKIGVKSTAVLFGRFDLALVAVIQTLVLAGLAWVGQQAGLSWPYYLGLVAAAGFAVYQLWIARRREPAACFTAFLNNHWFGMVVFAGMVLNYYLIELQLI